MSGATRIVQSCRQRFHAGEQRFRVIQTRLVRNTDVSVLEGSKDRAVATLITCAGTWIPRENDYDQRRVVIAEAVGPTALHGEGLEKTL